MGTLTLTELKAEITASHGNRTDIASRLTRVLNLSQSRMSRIYKWEELEALVTSKSTAAGSRYVDLTSLNIREILSVVLVDGTNSRKLSGRIYRQLDQVSSYPEANPTGKPEVYSYFGKKLELYQVPDAIYTLRIRVSNWPTAFSDASPSATSDLDNKDDMLIALSNSWLFLTLGKAEDANKWWSIYRQMLASAIAEEGESPDLDVLTGGGAGVGIESATPWASPFVKSIQTE